MRKKITSRRKRVHISTRSRSRTPKHLRFHMIYIYSTMVIFGLTLTLTIVQKTIEPFAFGTPSSQYVLGESVSQDQTPPAEKPFYIKIFDIFLP